MRQNKLIGVTGGIGSGKSQVMKIIAKSFPTINMDELTDGAYLEGKDSLKEAFGEEIVSNGSIDKEKLRSIVFADKEKLNTLNEILHPIIIRKTLEKAKEQKRDVFVECPLLFEANLSDMFDEIWLVVAKEETKIKRLFLRNGYDEILAKKRIDAQLPDENKISKSDVIIHNDLSLTELENEVSLELEKYKNRI